MSTESASTGARWGDLAATRPDMAATGQRSACTRTGSASGSSRQSGPMVAHESIPSVPS